MKRKFISLVLAFCLLLSVMPVCAYYPVGEEIPETGVLIFNDLEGWSAPVDMMYNKGKGGRMFRAAGAFGNEDGNQYWTPTVRDNSLLFSLRDVNDKANTDVINTGKLKWQANVKVPKANDLAEGMTSSLYLYTNNYNGWHQSLTAERAYLASIDYKNDAPVISFGVKDVGYGRPSPNADGSNAKTIEFDKWYTLTVIVDYDLKEVNYYIDGELVAYYMGDASTVVKQFGCLLGGFAQGGTASSNFACVDNFLVERLSPGFISAKAAEKGKNYVDVKFASTLDKTTGISPSDYELKLLGENSTVSPETVEFVTADTLRFAFAEEFEQSATYELILNGTLYEAGNSSKVVKVGTKVLFATDGESIERTLLQQNFDDLSFPTAENSADFTDFYYEGRKATDGVIDTTDDFIAQPEKTADYVSAFDATEGKMLKFTHNDMYPQDGTTKTYYKNLVIPFDEGMTASGGELTFEFDLMSAYTGGANNMAYYDIGFGLHDLKQEATAFNYNTTMADATMFAGLGYYSGQTKALSYGLPTRRARFATWYNGTHPANQANAIRGQQGAWWTSDAVCNLQSVKATALNEELSTIEASMNRYKIVVDINGDDSKFEIYFNGELKGTYNYIPGGVTDVEYDALVFTFIGEEILADGRNMETRPCNTYIDNISVKQLVKASNSVLGISFEKYDGTEYSYGDLLPAGTRKMKINFANEVNAVSASQQIDIKGAGDTYNIDTKGSSVVIDFDNCLTPNTEYTVTINECLLDKDGMPLGRNVAFTVNTDEGEVIYKTPVVKCNGSLLSAASNIASGDVLTVEAEFVNTTLDKKGSYVVLLAYKDSYLKGVAYAEYVADGTSPYTDTLTITKTADDTFVGADAVKAFVFDNISDLKPLTDAFVVE